MGLFFFQPSAFFPTSGLRSVISNPLVFLANQLFFSNGQSFCSNTGLFCPTQCGVFTTRGVFCSNQRLVSNSARFFPNTPRADTNAVRSVFFHSLRFRLLACESQPFRNTGRTLGGRMFLEKAVCFYPISNNPDNGPSMHEVNGGCISTTILRLLLLHFYYC